MELEEGLDQRHELYRLPKVIDWGRLEGTFESLYAQRGCPGLPIRRLAGLLILKQLYNLSDESVCERWRENPYMQYFCGETYFRWGYPCEPSELVHFSGRKAGFATLAQSAVIVGVASFEDTLDDGDSLPKTLACTPVYADKSYRRGASGKNAYQKHKHRKRRARRASIEPLIGHLKRRLPDGALLPQRLPRMRAQ